MPLSSALVVDDDRAIRSLVRTILEREGYAVDEAADGRDAIARIARRHYDILLLDLMMPNGSGEDVLDALRIATPERKQVIIISAASAAKLAAVDSPNVAARLRKPFDLTDLIETVHRCTGSQPVH